MNSQTLFEILQLREAGMTLEQIGELYGVTKQCIHQKVSVRGKKKDAHLLIDQEVTEWLKTLSERKKHVKTPTKKRRPRWIDRIRMKSITSL